MPYEQCSHGYVLSLVWLEEWDCAPAIQNPAMNSMQVVELAKIASIVPGIDIRLLGQTDHIDIIGMIAYAHL